MTKSKGGAPSRIDGDAACNEMQPIGAQGAMPE